MRTTAWIVQQDTEACRYAEEIRAKLNAGREVTNIEMGQLAAAVYAEALGVGEKRTAEEQEAPEDDLGEGEVDGEDAYQQDLEEALGQDVSAGEDALTEELPGDIINIKEDNFVIPPVTSEISLALIAEVQTRGDKISPDKVLGITRDLAGHIVWLETGHLGEKASGLVHIMDRHEMELDMKGIASSDIPNFILTTVTRGTIVGYQGRGTGRPIFEIVYKGRKYKIAVTVGSNGYIVGANVAE